MPLPPASSASDEAHDFDFNFGVRKTHIRRLQKPLTGSHIWTDYNGTSVVIKVWGGRASLFELEANGPAGHIEGVGLRLFNPKSHQWTLNLANSSDPAMTTPMVGRFVNGQGQFYDQENSREKLSWPAMAFPPLPQTRASLNRRSPTTLARRGRQTGS
jgi:hypothetical protein